LLNRILIIVLIIAFRQPISAHTGHSHDSNATVKGRVFGTVIDSANSSPIEYVSISIKESKSESIITGALTDKTGRFSIKNIPAGHYNAIIEFIGYKAKTIEGIAIIPNEENGLIKDLGTILLSVTAVNMDAVDVVGDDSQFIQKIDKQIFNVGKNLSVSGGTGTDVLRKVPTVDVDIDGQVSIAGDANVTVLIDGKKSGLAGTTRRGEVDNISASMIERVEVITNPSAKYDPDGVGGIINIVLKRGTNEGFNGSVSVLAGQYNKKNYNGNINYRTQKWNAFINGNYSAGDRIGDGVREFQYVYPTKIDSLFQLTTRTMSPTNMSMRLGGDYYPSKTSSFGYTLTVADQKDDTENGIDYIVNTRDTTKLGNVSFVNHDNGFHLDNTIYFENNYDSDNKHLKIVADLSYELDDLNEYGTSTDVSNPASEDSETNVKEENNGRMVSLDYKNRLSQNIGFEIGGKAFLKSYQTDLDYLNHNYQSIYTEDIYAAYATGDIELTDRFSIKAGARFEQVETNAEVSKLASPDALDSTNVILKIFDLATEESPYENPYSSIYPSAFLLYKLTDKQTVQFGYSKKVNRPRRRSLSPFPRNTSDVSRIRNGNPYLDPEYSDVMELKFSSNSRKLNFNSGLSYKLTKDAIMWWDRDVVEFNGTTYEVLTADNSENSKSLGGNLTLFYRPFPMTSIMVSGWAWNTETYGNGESDLNGDTKGYYLRSQLTLNVPSIARFEFSVGGRGKMKITSGTIPASFRADLGIQKSFLRKKLSITMKLNDVFDSGKFKINTEHEITNPITDDTYTQIMYAERQRNRRAFSVVFNYNFGKQQKKKFDRSQFQRNGGGSGMEMDY